MSVASKLPPNYERNKQINELSFTTESNWVCMLFLIFLFNLAAPITSNLYESMKILIRFDRYSIPFRYSKHLFLALAFIRMKNDQENKKTPTSKGTMNSHMIKSKCCITPLQTNNFHFIKYMEVKCVHQIPKSIQ